MEHVKRRKQRFFLVLGLILLLIVTGLGMVYRVFDRYGDILLASEDDQLFRLARSVDRSVESYLNRYGTNLIYVTDRRGFHTAEETWRSTGDTAELLYRMEENVLAQDDLIQAVLALQDGAVFLSTGGRTDYRFPPRAGREGTVSIRPCMDGDGGIYLAFVREREEGLSYAALMDLEGFYQRVAGDLTVGTQDRIMLLDAGGQTLLHRTMDGVQVDLVDDLKAGDCDFSGLTYLMEHQEQAREGTAFYETNYCRSGETYIARMAVLPATEETNGFFAVGVSVNYDGVIGPLHLAAVRLLAYGGMVVTGIVLLAVLSIRAGRRNERSLRELAVLRKKNQAMEELNRQTRELAHHQRLETIGTLTSSIAHEFNNLLTPIMGYSILALEKLPPEDTELYDSVLEIYNASRKAKTIISRLSDLSRKNSALSFQYVSPDELVRRVLEVAAPAQPPGVEVISVLDCRHLWLHGNETQLSQLLLNLVLNAFQAMEEDGGTLTVSTSADQSSIRLRVADTGPGIPPEVLPHIFEPFFTTKESGKGTGLGLAIVQQVVEEHRGRVEVEAAPEGGAAFTVTFPITPREAEPD
ncbi:ATP-binding protein [Intestinimonas massiliensis]|uniref:histidine kinase n=1 Tax=Intestinimonas massiliensis (ex Afouda et al. 2020) TaxID=1673721 RepID=A0AAW5JJR0_9FIRM|nr:ATP-binding protein [Intestinimonas massiliensis (ex Afouda et al. 2020)]